MFRLYITIVVILWTPAHQMKLIHCKYTYYILSTVIRNIYQRFLNGASYFLEIIRKTVVSSFHWTVYTTFMIYHGKPLDWWTTEAVFYPRKLRRLFMIVLLPEPRIHIAVVAHGVRSLFSILCLMPLS